MSAAMVVITIDTSTHTTAHTSNNSPPSFLKPPTVAFASAPVHAPVSAAYNENFLMAWGDLVGAGTPGTPGTPLPRLQDENKEVHIKPGSKP